MYKLHNHCRACGFAESITPPGIKAQPTGEKLIKVFSLGLQPLANDFCKDGEEMAGYAPLEVLFCPRCTLGQLSVVVRPEILYRKYAYVTSRSETMVKHFRSLWSFINTEVDPKSIVEIGSNDGFFLEYAKSRGVETVCGIDASENLSEEARKNGIQTLYGLFDVETARTARGCAPLVEAIVARHVFCHVEDWRGFMRSLDVLANQNTIILIEVPWAKWLLERCEFDTIYHEHTSYLTLRSMAALLENTPFRLHRVNEFPIHGGALGIMLRSRAHPSQPHDSVFQMLEAESVTAKDWERMFVRSAFSIERVKSAVQSAIGNGMTVAAYGASAKATVWMNVCGFTRKEIKFVTDTTPHKQYCLIPGTDIPVVDPGALLREKPDFALLTAWNFCAEIMAKEQLYRDQGGKFIVPHTDTPSN